MKRPQHFEIATDGKKIGSADYSAQALADILYSYADVEDDEDLRGYLLWAAEKLNLPGVA